MCLVRYNQNKKIYLATGLSSGGAGYLYDYNSSYMKYYEYGKFLAILLVKVQILRYALLLHLKRLLLYIEVMAV